MANPLILAIDDDAAALGVLERELEDRYARYYEVACLRSPDAALARLETAAAADEPVALVMAAQQLGNMTGGEFLARVRHLHPHAKRTLLIEWGGLANWTTGAALFDAMARGDFDHHLIAPGAPPDERFHQSVSGFLLEWAEAQRIGPHTTHVVGASWSGRAYELREVLQRCALPHSFCLADSAQGRTIMAEAGIREGEDLPLVVFPNGTVLVNPSAAEIALGAGSSVEPTRTEFDVVIVGAGPSGLSAAVYGASEGFSTLIVDEGGLGGQATSSSLIRNYLGFPLGIPGGRLAQRAYEQAWVFGASFAFMQRVVALSRDHDDRLALDLSVSGRVTASAVILATGASYRRLGIPQLEALNGAGVFYGGTASEAPGMAGRDVVVVGGANSAGQAALHLARHARRVTLAVRASSLGAGMSRYLVREVEAVPNLDVRLGTEVVGGGGDGWLEHLVLRGPDGQEETMAASGLFLMIGAHPRTDWLPDEIARDRRGFILTGADVAADTTWPLARRPFPLETSMPRVLAAGDVRHGSVKRVASAVGEGSIAVQILHALFAEDRLHPSGRLQGGAPATR